MTQFTEINNDLIIRYLRNDLSETEKLKVIAWLESDQQNLDFLLGLKEAYTVSRWNTIKETADTENEWNKMHSQLISNKKSVRISRKKIFLQFSRYAALLFIAFGLGFGYNLFLSNSDNHKTTFTTGLGRSSTVVLADGSTATLNAKSTLTYSTELRKAREVSLDGEAVFNVKKDNGRPFFVNTSKYKVKVLGTVFNVSTYSNDDYISTTLKTGKVQIIENKTDKVLSELKEGERFYLDKSTGNYSIKMQSDLNNDFGWYLGKLCFNDITLADLANKLEREYGYSFEIKNPDFQTFRYKAYVERESLDNILKYISLVTPNVRYRINKEKKQVLLY